MTKLKSPHLGKQKYEGKKQESEKTLLKILFSNVDQLTTAKMGELQTTIEQEKLHHCSLQSKTKRLYKIAICYQTLHYFQLIS